jgi:mono/diheme cytochrome c family protein
MHRPMLILIAGGVLAGCGGSNAMTGGGAPTTGEEQAALGAEVYGARCAHCHREDASGDPGIGAPALVGDGALAGYATAADVYDFVVVNMPGDAPGSLNTEEYLAVLAFALSANGVAPGPEPLTREDAAGIMLNE